MLGLTSEFDGNDSCIKILQNAARYLLRMNFMHQVYTYSSQYICYIFIEFTKLTCDNNKKMTTDQLDWQQIVLCTITVRADNEHAKLSCAPPSQYKATLCTTKVYIGTELQYEPWFACSLSTTKILYYASMPLCTTCVCSDKNCLFPAFGVNYMYQKN